MRIDLSNKSLGPCDQTVVLSRNDAVSLFEELNLEGTLRGEFQVYPQGDDSFLVRGSVSGSQLLTCVRSLESFSCPFSVEVVMDVKKVSGLSAQEVEDEDGDTYVVRIPAFQEEVDVSECVRELVLLQEPMRPVKDPAKDFVWKDSAEAEVPASDPRWDKLKALKAKLDNPNGQG